MIKIQVDIHHEVPGTLINEWKKIPVKLGACWLCCPTCWNASNFSCGSTDHSQEGTLQQECDRCDVPGIPTWMPGALQIQRDFVDLLGPSKSNRPQVSEHCFHWLFEVEIPCGKPTPTRSMFKVDHRTPLVFVFSSDDLPSSEDDENRCTRGGLTEKGVFVSHKTHSEWLLMSGWWWMVAMNFEFSHEYWVAIIIPIDVHIFQRGGPTTNQLMLFEMVWTGVEAYRYRHDAAPTLEMANCVPRNHPKSWLKTVCQIYKNTWDVWLVVSNTFQIWFIYVYFHSRAGIVNKLMTDISHWACVECCPSCQASNSRSLGIVANNVHDFHVVANKAVDSVPWGVQTATQCSLLFWL